MYKEFLTEKLLKFCALLKIALNDSVKRLQMEIKNVRMIITRRNTGFGLANVHSDETIYLIRALWARIQPKQPQLLVFLSRVASFEVGSKLRLSLFPV